MYILYLIYSVYFDIYIYNFIIKSLKFHHISLHYSIFLHIPSHSLTFPHISSHSPTFPHITPHSLTFPHITPHSLTFLHIPHSSHSSLQWTGSQEGRQKCQTHGRLLVMQCATSTGGHSSQVTIAQYLLLRLLSNHTCQYLNCLCLFI